MFSKFQKMFAAAKLVAPLVALAWPVAVPALAQDVQVDTALIVSVDVSNSVDSERYTLQMEGIAKALEDPSVIEAIISGPNGGILFSMMTWADGDELKRTTKSGR